MRLRPLGVLLATVALVGGTGFSLAQDQNQLQGGETAAPSSASQAPAPLAGSPDKAAADVDAAPPPEPAPPDTTTDNAVADDGDTTQANIVSAPAAPVAAPTAPPVRPKYGAVVLQALDKVTAETLRFEAKVNEPVRYKDLVITVHACETQASDEPYPQTAAHLQVQYQPDVLPAHGGAVARQVFLGWMYGEAPGLHPFEHPIYDLWVIACRTPSAASAPVGPAGASR